MRASQVPEACDQVSLVPIAAEAKARPLGVGLRWAVIVHSPFATDTCDGLRRQPESSPKAGSPGTYSGRKAEWSVDPSHSAANAGPAGAVAVGVVLSGADGAAFGSLSIAATVGSMTPRSPSARAASGLGLRATRRD